jgi:signal transduction histidine kinase/CheY-like chemotaxis protein
MTAANSRSIRWHLFQVLLVCVFPVGLFGAGMLFLHWQAQERERERLQLESSRLLAAAVDNALDGTIQRLSILARLWASAPAREEQIYAQAKTALEANPDWTTIVAFAADGRPVFRTDEPFGAAGSMSMLGLWLPVIRDAQPVVSNVFTGPRRNLRLVAVGVPVVRAGRATHVLIAGLRPQWFDELIKRQAERGGVAAILDTSGKFVARSTDADRLRGGDPSAGFVERTSRTPEGVERFANLEGKSVYTAWTRTRHGWLVAIATPAGPIDGAFWRYFAVFCGLWAAVLALGVYYAVRKGRQITASLATVEAQAAHLGRGERPPEHPASDVAEVNDALRALARAGAVLEQAVADRESALEIERLARITAEAASRAKDQFLAMLGHELRNPLAAISNAAATVRAEGRTAEQVRFSAEVIARQSVHLKRLIDDLLQVGRVMSGKILLERQPVDLEASVRQVVSSLSTAGRLAGRRLELELSPVWVNGDLTRIEQIITNLLANAATHTREGGRIRVTLREADGSAELRVEDDGDGIAPEDLAMIFELFFQAEPATDRARGGLGIGLTLVQRLVALHGGSVTARSEGKGRGATFVVLLPASSAPEAPAPPVRDRAAAAQRVLLVEDNADTRESLRMALELHGHSVLQAADGPAALEELRRSRPRIAIIDIGLPGMDGFQLARRMRAEADGAIRLIALTGYGAPSDIARAKEAGFDIHLTKPVDVAELVGIISRPAP